MSSKCRGKICLLLNIMLIIATIILFYFLIVSFINGDITSKLLYVIIVGAIMAFLGNLIAKVCGCDKNDSQEEDLDIPNKKKQKNDETEDEDDDDNDNEVPNESVNPKKKGKTSNGVEWIILLIFIVFILYQADMLPFFGSSNPVGRWTYEMEENTVINGVENLTDYWYMDFYEDGTVILGVKNVGFPEDQEGSGGWYKDGDVINVSLNYDWGGGYTESYIIRNNQLIVYDTDVPSGYYRD